MGWEGVSDKMVGVSNGKVLAFGGVEVQFPTFGPTGADVQGALKNVMAVTGGMNLPSSVCCQVIWQVIDVDYK